MEPSQPERTAPVDGAQFERSGVVVLVDRARRIAHITAACEGLLAEPAEALIGGALHEALGAEVDRALNDILEEGVQRAGGWWPSTLPHGGRVRLRAFDAGPDLVGLDLLPAAVPEPPDARSIERVAAWNDWLLACTSSTELLEVAVSITRERTGFDGAWACRAEGEGDHVVVAVDVRADTAMAAARPVWVHALPATQPVVRGRAMPFFVGDLGPSAVQLVPGAPDLDVDGSFLLRPAPHYLDRLATLGVRSTASLPLVVDGRLWGRIVAHHAAVEPVSAATQSELRLLAAATSARLVELIEQEDAREQVELGRFSLRLMGTIASSSDLVDALTRKADDLTGVCAADGAVVAIGGRVASAGPVIDDQQVEALLAAARAALVAAPETTVVAAVAFARDAGIDPATAAGFLAVRLGRTPDDVVLWTRTESTRAATWVEHEVVGDALADELLTGVTRRGDHENRTCAPWTTAQLAQADQLRDAIGQVQLARYRQMQALNDELMRSNEEYDAFAHAAAHDLKTPLRGIRHYVDFHLEDTEDRLKPEEQEQLRTVTRLTDRMNALLDDLLAYAQSGGEAPSASAIRLPDAVGEVVELLGPRAAELEVEVTAQPLRTDPAALRQILLNLLGNAIKYSESPARVTIDVTSLDALAPPVALPSTLAGTRGDTPVLTVADRGVGIGPDHHERVFRLFHQLDPASEGTGTGLAMCRRICRRRGGEIWLGSEPGEGTTFYVVLGRDGRAATA